jgi:oligopeptide transport system substrate-binding protein
MRVLVSAAILGILGSPQSQNDRIAQAKKLLAEAGYPEGSGFPKAEVLYNTSEAHEKIAAAIQNMWRKNLGIEVELRNTEWKVYLDTLTKLEYQIARRGWIGDYRDPNTFIDLFASWSGNSNTGWKSAEFDRLVKAAAAEPDAAKRMEHLKGAERILMQELPVVPIYFYVTHNMWKPYVKGVFSNIQDTHPLTEVVAEGRERLRINNGAEPQTLDPNLMRGVPEARIAGCLFEGLTSNHPRTLDPVPGVAEKWEISADGKTYTFRLRDCKWSDGRPVTAHDFVFGWRRILNPSTPTDYAGQLYTVKNAEAYNQKKIDDPSKVGVRAEGDRTLVVELENPCAYFLELCSFFTYYPIRQDVVEKHGDKWTRPGNIVCNGPFRLKEWRPNESILCERNPEYWNAAKVKQKLVEWQPVDSASTAFNMYEEDQCDWLTTVPLEAIEELMKREDYHSDTYLGVYYYSFNVNKPPFNDARVRRALALAIDREVLCLKILQSGEKPAYSITPPAFSNYTPPRFAD